MTDKWKYNKKYTSTHMSKGVLYVFHHSSSIVHKVQLSASSMTSPQSSHSKHISSGLFQSPYDTILTLCPLCFFIHSTKSYSCHCVPLIHQEHQFSCLCIAQYYCRLSLPVGLCHFLRQDE